MHKGVLTLMYGGLNHFVFPPPRGPALTLDGKMSGRRNRLGGGRLDSSWWGRLGRLRASRSGRGQARGRLGLFHRRRPRQPLGRDL